MEKIKKGIDEWLGFFILPASTREESAADKSLKIAMRRFAGFLAAAMLSCVALAFIGCGSGSSIVGTWQNEKYDNDLYNISFYEDGKCTEISGMTRMPSNDTESYSLESDGTLFFQTSYGDRLEVSKTSSEEEALENSGTYYLSGDVLVIGENKYARQ